MESLPSVSPPRRKNSNRRMKPCRVAPPNPLEMTAITKCQGSERVHEVPQALEPPTCGHHGWHVNCFTFCQTVRRTEKGQLKTITILMKQGVHGSRAALMDEQADDLSRTKRRGSNGTETENRTMEIVYTRA